MLKVELVGHLGADAKVENVQGVEFVSMRVAHSDRYRDGEGNMRETTTWVDVTLNFVSQSLLSLLVKGACIFVRGNAQLRAYSSPKDRCWKAGIKVYAMEIEVMQKSDGASIVDVYDTETGSVLQVSKALVLTDVNDLPKKGALRNLVDTNNVSYVADYRGVLNRVQNDPTKDDKDNNNDEKGSVK